MTSQFAETRVHLQQPEVGYFTLLGLCEYFQQFTVLIQHSVDTAKMYSAVMNQYLNDPKKNTLREVIVGISQQTDKLLHDMEKNLDRYQKCYSNIGYTFTELGFDTEDQIQVTESIFNLSCAHTNQLVTQLIGETEDIKKLYEVIQAGKIPIEKIECENYRSIIFDIGRFILCVSPYINRLYSVAESSARQQIKIMRQTLEGKL